MSKKLLFALSEIGSQQAAAREETPEAIDRLLDDVATNPDDSIFFRASDMILAGYADADFLNESKARSRAGDYIFLSKNEPKTKLNGPVLTIEHIIKSAIALAAKVEIAALYITSQKMVPLQNTLIEMGWPQPKSPIQTDNLTDMGSTNKTIVNKDFKSLYMQLWCIQDRESQDQFQYYWAPGPENEGDYSTTTRLLT